MGKNKIKQVTKQPVADSKPLNTERVERANQVFGIPYPALVLVLAVLAVYFSAFSFGFTELDDSIFIKEFRAYNEDTQNLFTSFTRGLFDAAKDPYYRPLFSDAMILNYQLSGDSPGGYHFVNVLLHIVVVLLLFRLGGKLGISRLHSFLLALLFAVHPVLSQAVAWIPGRNDTMLAVFVLSFFIYSVNYTLQGKVKYLIWSAIFLQLAFFTKETAVFAAPAAFMLLVFYIGRSWKSKPMIVQYAMWAGCFGVWYLARSLATIQSSGIGSSQAFSDFLHRLPVIVQYIGKIVLPFNLSVFPTQQDTVLYFGIVATIILSVIIVMSLVRANTTTHPGDDNAAIGLRIFGALGVFLLFLMPALLVPQELNQQTFEHRLYLPLLGILLLLPQTVAFRNRLTEKQLSFGVFAVCGLFAILNFRHQQYFDNPVSFWSQAVETSPNSAYANMMLAARLDKSENARSEALFRKAYRLNPKEKYLNFYMGEMLQKKDSALASEPYLLAEKKISNYIQCDFYLARVAMEKHDIPGAISYLQEFLKRDKFNPMANNNLLLFYIEMQQTENAKAQAMNMRRMGMEVPMTIARQLGI